ncbi:Glutathione-specific gamma-glutamylcyclotransferase 1 [Lamellibrachia satsuma]|nr:Glutathione-specific gamma-glutamylcyclotransferase 1 [Lamellibrachia satsuma]
MATSTLFDARPRRRVASCSRNDTAEMEPLNEHSLANVSSLWVFGYGSVLWKTGFEYTTKQTGYIRGFVRRFWQGSCTHRGTPEAPGRVATLVPQPQGQVWGIAFKLVGVEMVRSALAHLGLRECSLGGYTFNMQVFHDRSGATVPVLVFLATPDNALYLGDCEQEELAAQVIACNGYCGHNIEYVTRLADFMRTHIPEETDLHLFGLVDTIKAVLRQRNVCMERLISDARSTMPEHVAACTSCAESDFKSYVGTGSTPHDCVCVGRDLCATSSRRPRRPTETEVDSPVRAGDAPVLEVKAA